MIDYAVCLTCGTQILAATAVKTGGLCMPCKGNYRHSIEASRKRLQREKQHRASPAAKHWEWLVARIYEDKAGFSRLSPEEQKYFAGRVLIGEIYNGGFFQYFDNSSVDYYSCALEILLEVGAENSIRLLREAKEVVFGPHPIPKSEEERFAVLSHIMDGHSPLKAAKLENLDQEFWKDLDGLEDRIEQYAEAKGLRKNF